MVICLSREKDFPCVEFIESAAYRPHIDSIIIGFSDDCKKRKKNFNLKNKLNPSFIFDALRWFNIIC